MVTTATGQGYVHHRDRQRERILTKAEQLFLEHGIAHVSISDIADAAEITRATIYRYFANRTIIADTILQRYIKEFHDSLPAHVWDEQAPAVERLHGWMTAVCAYFFAHPQHVHYRLQYEELPRENDITPGMRTHETMAMQHPLLLQILQSGQQDGTLIVHEDIDKVYATITIMISGFERSLLLSNRAYSTENEYDLSSIYVNFCDVILYGLVKNSAIRCKKST